MFDLLKFTTYYYTPCCQNYQNKDKINPDKDVFLPKVNEGNRSHPATPEKHL